MLVPCAHESIFSFLKTKQHFLPICCIFLHFGKICWYVILMKIFLLYTHVCGRSKVESPSLDVSEGPAHSYPWEGYPPSVHQPQSDTTPAPPATPTYANLFTWRDDRCDLHQSANTVGGADVREQINPPTASITLLLFTTHVELINIDMLIWSEILDPQPFIEIYLLTLYYIASSITL